ncbi:MAG TPA: GNAT family protein [Thermoanaerobaculia bacterium]|jgi:RimJ/RimL family protein N-acetyltransferase|nr:GNAT family protein [Thermoanaerobaculia bacterium]
MREVWPVCLAGPTIRLEPLTVGHAHGLFRHAWPEIFHWFLDFPRDESYVAFEAYVDRTLLQPNSLDFAILLKATGEPIGATGLLDIRLAHQGLEIGRTWIAASHQGTRVNPESKYLLLRHAFEELGALRVQFKTDQNNVHSQRAIEKLGARREGVLRNYQCRSNGKLRNTLMYSIIGEEWPDLKHALEARLAAM